MNRKYYCSIYLNPHPTPMNMSLLDTYEMLRSEKDFKKQILFFSDTVWSINIQENSRKVLFESKIGQDSVYRRIGDSWLKIESRIKINSPGMWGCYLNSELSAGDSVKFNKIRLDNAISPQGQPNEYAFYVKIPPYFNKGDFRLFLSSSNIVDGEVQKISIQYLSR
jgi:hypothetical protein